jgi:hypothetical protein
MTTWCFLSLLKAKTSRREGICMCGMSCRREPTRFGFELGVSCEHGNDTSDYVRSEMS